MTRKNFKTSKIRTNLNSSAAAAKPVNNNSESLDDSQALRKLIMLGIALSAERNHDRLMEQILLNAMEFTHADGGTLYEIFDPDALSFCILRNRSLGSAMGGTSGIPIRFPPLRMVHDDGTPNYNNVATFVAITNSTINIPDAYEAKDFDFSGTKNFDNNTGYRSKSMLAVPLTDHENRVIGVIQLLNAIDPVTMEVVEFPTEIEPLIEALAGLASIAVSNQKLIEEQRNLLNAVINMMAQAIDKKSTYTGGHCVRVPIIMDMIAHAACKSDRGIFKDFELTEDQWFEIQVAAGLHDIGKVATPDHIMDKATKLEQISDRIEEIKLRFEILKGEAEVEMWKAIAKGENEQFARSNFDSHCAQLDVEFDLISHSNIGSETLPQSSIEQMKKIAARKVTIKGAATPLLNAAELQNLSIQRGTLNDNDRKIINNHIVITIDMLKTLPLPKYLANVVEIAGGHHERMDGKGYPNGLKGDDMSVLARMLGIADVFEALTATDRPYKKAKPLSECLNIMTRMAIEGHIDPEIYRLFIESKVYRDYSLHYLKPENIDEVNPAALLKQLDEANLLTYPIDPQNPSQISAQKTR
ncbi:MAG: HD domain-containing phosphohydrolase [Candidatus Pacebacteria bacterium]|nr:HD domain-containing phosphohydrolase [Candidatus Paceibacterota bacterium]